MARIGNCTEEGVGRCRDLSATLGGLCATGELPLPRGRVQHAALYIICI